MSQFSEASPFVAFGEAKVSRATSEISFVHTMENSDGTARFSGALSGREAALIDLHARPDGTAKLLSIISGDVLVLRNIHYLTTREAGVTDALLTLSPMECRSLVGDDLAFEYTGFHPSHVLRDACIVSSDLPFCDRPITGLTATRDGAGLVRISSDGRDLSASEIRVDANCYGSCPIISSLECHNDMCSITFDRPPLSIIVSGTATDTYFVQDGRVNWPYAPPLQLLDDEGVLERCRPRRSPVGR